jgi:formate dehydrogenase subunit gamma
VWRDVRSGQENFTTIKGRETGVLIQSGGDTWRRVRNGPVTFYGGLLVVLIAAAILAFYSIFGAVKLHEKPTGRLMQRFTGSTRSCTGRSRSASASSAWAG